MRIGAEAERVKALRAADAAVAREIVRRRPGKVANARRKAGFAPELRGIGRRAMPPIENALVAEGEVVIAEETESARALRTQNQWLLRTVSRVKSRLGVADDDAVAVEEKGRALPQGRTAVLPRVRPLTQASEFFRPGRPLGLMETRAVELGPWARGDRRANQSGVRI